jgi:hypothetical protein
MPSIQSKPAAHEDVGRVASESVLLVESVMGPLKWTNDFARNATVAAMSQGQVLNKGGL